MSHQYLKLDFLWGYVKSVVYSNKSSTVEPLKRNIVGAIAEIQSDVKKWLKIVLTESTMSNKAEVAFK